MSIFVRCVDHRTTKPKKKWGGGREGKKNDIRIINGNNDKKNKL